jgi:hypothetical protein
LLLLAALLHDAAKPLTRSVEPSGRVRFLDHEQRGVELARQRAAALRLSSDESERLALVVGHHMRPHHLALAETGPTRRAVYRYFRSAGPAGVDAAYLSLADTLATYGPSLPQDVWLRQVDIARILLEAWWETPEQVYPPALLTGHDLMALFGLAPGPKLGELLDQLREAQAVGEVKDREEAVRFVEKLVP